MMAIKEKNKNFIYYCFISNKILYFGNTELNHDMLCVLKELRKHKYFEFNDVIFETKNKESYRLFRNLQHIKINEESAIIHLNMEFIDDAIHEDEYSYIDFDIKIVNAVQAFEKHMKSLYSVKKE